MRQRPGGWWVRRRERFRLMEHNVRISPGDTPTRGWQRTSPTTTFGGVRGGWAVLVAALLLGLWPAVAGAQSDEGVRRVARQLQCPVCEGQTVAESNSGLAQDMRAVIRTKMESGETDQQIIDTFVAAYGDGILSEPPKRGAGLGVWLAPAAVLVAGIAVLAVLARKWTRHPEPTAPHAAPTSIDPGVADELRRFRERYGA